MHKDTHKDSQLAHIGLPTLATPCLLSSHTASVFTLDLESHVTEWRWCTSRARQCVRPDAEHRQISLLHSYCLYRVAASGTAVLDVRTSLTVAAVVHVLCLSPARNSRSQPARTAV